MDNLQLLLASTVSWWALFYLCNHVVELLFPGVWRSYMARNAKDRTAIDEDEATHKRISEFRVAFVAFVHAVFVVQGVVRYFYSLDNIIWFSTSWPCDPTYTDDYTQFYLLVSAGYFVHDAMAVILIDFSWPFFLHGVICTLSYSGAVMLPYLQFYGMFYLLFEASTPFLHIRWFLIKTRNTGNSLFFLANYGFAATFLIVRILIGYPSQYMLWQCTMETPDEVANLLVRGYYVVSSATLCLLNAFWMYKIVQSAQKSRSQSLPAELSKPRSSDKLLQSKVS